MEKYVVKVIRVRRIMKMSNYDDCLWRVDVISMNVDNGDEAIETLEFDSEAEAHWVSKGYTWKVDE